MAGKLLFKSSNVFANADDLDCIHQCDIDLRTRTIPLSEVEELMDNILSSLDANKFDINYQLDLLSLLYDCFSKYPSKLFSDNYYQKFNEKSFSSIINFNATIFISIALNRSMSSPAKSKSNLSTDTESNDQSSPEPITITLDRKFVEDALSYFKDQLKSSNSESLPKSINYNNLEFQKKDYLFSIHHLLRVFPVTADILSPFIPILFGEKNPKVEFRLDLVAHIAASNLLSLIPEKYYITLEAYIDAPSPSLVFQDLVPSIPKDAFFSIAPSLEAYLTSLGNREMSLVFFKKCCETGYTAFHNFPAFFELIDTNFLNKQMIEFLHSFEFTFTDNQASQLSDTAPGTVDFEKDSTFFIITLPEPQKFLSDESIESFFNAIKDVKNNNNNNDNDNNNDNNNNNNNDDNSKLNDGNNPNILRRALKPLFTHPSLTQTENWAKFIKIIDQNSFAPVCKCFVSNSIDIAESSIRLLMMTHLDTKVCDFLRAALNKENRDLFVTSPRMNELLSIINFQPSFSFWRLFSKSRGLIDFAVRSNFRCPFIMYGVVTVTSFTKLDPNFQTLYIEKQTPESLKKVEEYIKHTCINKTALFTSIDGESAELSLMAAGHYYGTRIAYHQAKSQIEGLNDENILHFAIVASMTYKVTNRLHAAPVFLDMFTDKVWYPMTIDGLHKATEELKNIYFDHILNAMPTLYLFNTFQAKLRPIVYDFFKRGEMLDGQIYTFLIHLSHSTASPTVFLRRSLIKDQAYLSVAKNEPKKDSIPIVREEERKFWDEIGFDAVKLLANREYKADFPLNFHCDCIKDKSLFNKMLNEEPTANLIRFLQDIAIATPKFEIEDAAPIYKILDQEIEKESWLNCESIIRFLCKNEKTEQLTQYFKRELPPLVNLALTSVFKQSDTASMRQTVTTDFVINLMSSQVRVLDTKVRYFVERILNDDDTLLLYYINDLKRIQRGFCVSTHTIAAFHWDEIQRNPELFGKAVHTIYEQPEDVPTVLIQRPNPLPTKKASDFSIEIAQKMIDYSFDDQNATLLCWTTYFIQSHGFLFENFDHIKYFGKMMSILKNFGHSKTESTFRASLTTLALLYFYISIPAIADSFFEWFFAFRNKFNPSQIYAFLLIVRAFLSVDSVRTVMAAVLVRYDFLSFLPSQYNEFEYCVVTKLFLEALKDGIESDYHSFDALVSCKLPFSTAFDIGSQSMQRMMMQSNPLTFIANQLDEDDQSYISTITRDRFFKRESDNADGRVLEKILSKYHRRNSKNESSTSLSESEASKNESSENTNNDNINENTNNDNTNENTNNDNTNENANNDNTNENSNNDNTNNNNNTNENSNENINGGSNANIEIVENEEEEMFVPEWSSKDVFSNLSQRMVSTLLHHRIPAIPATITPEMSRYLITCQKWVGAWIRNPSSLLLLPSHYKVLYETIENLHRIEKHEMRVSFDYVTRHDYQPPNISEDIKIEIEFVKNLNVTPKLPFVINPTVKPDFIPTLFEILPDEMSKLQVSNDSNNGNDSPTFNNFRLNDAEQVDEKNGCIFFELWPRSSAETMEDTFFSNQLFESLLKIASFGEMSELFESLLKTLGEYQPALTSILDHICDILPGISNGKLISCARVLAGVSKCDSFTTTFNTHLSKNFQTTICAPQFHLSTVLFNVVSSIFDNIKSNVPDQTVQVIEQMLLSGGNCFSAALVPYSKLSNDKKKILTDSIAVACDATLTNSIENAVFSTTELLTILKTVPELMKKRKERLLIILRKLLERYDPANNELLIHLFGVTSPTPSELKFTSRQENSNVPQEVIDRNPVFWEMVIKYSSILSKLLSSDKSLINNSLSFIKSFPSLLDFPMKLSIFHESCKKKLTNRIFHIKVHRDKIIEDSLAQVQLSPIDTFLGEISVQFAGEQGIDMGGLKREWFTLLIKSLFNPEIALFTEDREPNPGSKLNPEHLFYFNFAGKMIARAIIDNINVDCPLSNVLCKEILGVKVTLRDLEKTDEQLFNSLKWISQNDVSELDMRFTFGADELGEHKEIPLVEDGENVVVTNENKESFIEKVVRYRLV